MSKLKRTATIVAPKFASFTDTVSESDSELVQAGLLFYESEGKGHRDSQGRVWKVSADDIIEIAENTNALLDKTDIGVFKEHNKTADHAVGVIEDYVEARPITEADVAKKPKLQNLVGKYGIFTSACKIIDPTSIEKMRRGLGKAVSCGVDFGNKVIRELSIVGIGALPQAGFFSQEDGGEDFAYFSTPALTINEALEESQAESQQKEEAHSLLDTLFAVIDNINNLSDQDLEGQGRDSYYEGVIQEFMDMLPDYLPLQDDAQHEQQMMQRAQSPGGRFQQEEVLAAFTLDEMEENYGDFFLQNPLQRRKKKEGLLGKAVKGAALVGAGVAGGALAGRYGVGKAIRRGAVGAKMGFGLSRSSGLSMARSVKNAAIGSGMGIKSGFNSQRLGKDVSRVKTAVGNRFRRKPPGA